MAKTNADGSKSLGRGDLLAIAIGNVIGGGVMTMTGLAIGITGRSIVLSYIICAVMVTIVALPQFLELLLCDVQFLPSIEVDRVDEKVVE